MTKVCENCHKVIKWNQSYSSYNYAVRGSAILYTHVSRKDCDED